MPRDEETHACERCAEGRATLLDFSPIFAFQPIVDVRTGAVFAEEALVRGDAGQSAEMVLGRIGELQKYEFDQTCRVTAIETAATHGIDTAISINFMPNAVYKPEHCIRRTLAAAERFGWPLENLIFEFTEHEEVSDIGHIRGIIECYREIGFRTAIDDFGAGHSNLGLLVDLQPDLIKIDRNIVREVDRDTRRQAILRGILTITQALSVEVIAEGIEREAEAEWLVDAGIHLMQGYHYGRPRFLAGMDGAAVPA